MATLRDLYYSPVCDSDVRAYLAFVFACGKHGSGHVGSAALDGVAGQSRRDGSGDNVVDGIAGASVGVWKDEASHSMDGVAANGGVVRYADIISGRFEVGLCNWFAAAGISAGDFDNCVGGAVGSGGVYAGCQRGFDDTDVSDESVAVNDGLDDGGSDAYMEKKEKETVGAKTLANREKRKKKKERKWRKRGGSFNHTVADRNVPVWRRGAMPLSDGGEKKSFFSDCDQDVQKQLADTRARRYIAENLACIRKAESNVSDWRASSSLKEKRSSLALLEVEQKLELARGRDLDKIRKRDEVRVMRDTELGKVAVERAFSSLSAAENVSYVGGVAKTIRSSISPSSSVSEAEIRAMQKENLDLKSQNAALVEKMREFRVGVNNDVAYSVGMTLDSKGHVVGDYGDCVGGFIGADGRLHTGEDYADY